ncbi:type 4b pilus protein PilO2 [Enterobacteriaceae bacterium H20N1]|uniref:Type 4b pilus protein PilO2 n=1 Tax=Dryocola boscaweniae TaxID=2925397 RepID=A0A9X3AMG1_9ENTR|nr:type 4b pilus protein PilO2 [Dryocola boscaweniae]MCT4700536.1 type 4b pilus protein PilO2 [Dryocola boscaweniae]MCT4717692.1 type 4b pilus protein PilO2 [Dryocola boscaweniae]
MKKPHKHKQSTSATEDSALALLAIKGRDMAVAGLIWQPIHTVRNVQAEARGLLKQEGCEYFLTYVKGNRAQCGMTRYLPSGKRCWSAVMMLCQELGDSWLGLFCLPDGRYWLAGTDNGMVVPGCDTIFDQRAQAAERYRDYADMFAWQAKYVSGIGIEKIDGQDIDLQSVLNRCTLKNNLRIAFAHETRRRLRRFASLGMLYGVLIAGVLGGWKYYQHRQEEERQAQLRAELLVRQRAVGFAERAWRSAIPAATMLKGCLEEINKQPVLIGGWQIVGLQCDGRRVIASYKGGHNSTSKEFIQQMQGQNYKFQKGMTVEVTGTLKLSGDRRHEKLQPIAVVAADFLENLQLGIAKGKFDDVLSTGKKVAKYELTTELSPLTLVSGWNMDGVVVRRLDTKFSAQGIVSWTMSGEIYGK